jgi:hypothetical protein
MGGRDPQERADTSRGCDGGRRGSEAMSYEQHRSESVAHGGLAEVFVRRV